MMKILIEVHSVLRHSEEEIEFFVGLREKRGGLLRNPKKSIGTPFCNFQRIPILYWSTSLLLISLVTWVYISQFMKYNFHNKVDEEYISVTNTSLIKRIYVPPREGLRTFIFPTGQLIMKYRVTVA
jgi:hypothetical protein